MNKFISKFSRYRLYLMYFVLLCCLLTSENLFSRKHWMNEDLVVKDFYKYRYISFFFLFHEHVVKQSNLGYLESADFSYSEDGVNYYPLMRAETTPQMGSYIVNIKLCNKPRGEKFHIFNTDRNENPYKWELTNDAIIPVKTLNERHKIDGKLERTKSSFLKVRWLYPASIRHIKSILIRGFWSYNGTSEGDVINMYYTPELIISHLNVLQNTPRVLTSRIIDQAHVTHRADAICVTGSEPGEQINVYTLSGVKVKSIIASEDIVKIKLPKNQIYIVNAGQKRYKVGL